MRVLVATCAFGMGIDVKCLSRVIHYGPPSDIDDYIQETGRAGKQFIVSTPPYAWGRGGGFPIVSPSEVNGYRLFNFYF